MWTLAPNVNTIGANTTPPRDATTAEDIAARLLSSPSGLHPQIKAPDTSELSMRTGSSAQGTTWGANRKERGPVNMLMFVLILYICVLMHKLQVQRYVINIHEYLDDVVITW